MTVNHLIIDGDFLVYMAAGSTQKVSYKVLDQEFKYKKDAKAYVKANGINESAIAKYTLTEPVENALHIIKKALEGYFEKFNTRLFTIYLGSDERIKNFRYFIPARKTYKGTRPPRPIHYNACREYLFNHWQARLVAEHIEVDDKIGQLLWSNYNDPDSEISYIAIHNDKDIFQVPGHHYRPTVDVVTHVVDPGSLLLDTSGPKPKLRGSGFKWFCAQMIMGDISDNVVGVDGWGDVYTFQALNDIEDMREMYNKVREIYKSEGIEEHFQNTADLLWIQREYGNAQDFLDKYCFESLL